MSGLRRSTATSTPRSGRRSRAISSNATYREGAFVRKGQVLFEIDRAAVRERAGPGAGASRREPRAARRRPSATSRATVRWPNSAPSRRASSTTTSARTTPRRPPSSRRKAAVDTAQLNLGFTRVTSLIDGVAAIATAQIGDLVGPTTLLTTVSQLDPIKAYFPLSEQEYLASPTSSATPAAPSKLWQAQRRPDAGARRRHALSAARARCSPSIARSIPRWARSASARFPESRQRAAPGQGGRVTAQTAVRDRRAARAAARGLGAPERLSAAGHRQRTTRSRCADVTLGARVGTRWIVETG